MQNTDHEGRSRRKSGLHRAAHVGDTATGKALVELQAFGEAVATRIPVATGQRPTPRNAPTKIYPSTLTFNNLTN
jgi:hypothetical protein